MNGHRIDCPAFYGGGPCACGFSRIWGGYAIPALAFTLVLTLLVCAWAIGRISS